MKSLLSYFFSFLIALIIAYFLFGAFLYFMQDSVLYHPNNQDFLSCAAFSDSQKVVVNSTRMYYTDNGGEKLAVFYHGNAGSACDRAYWRPILDRAGYSYVFVEYSGYSGENVSPTSKLLLKNVNDAQAFVKTLGEKKLTIIGESVGTGYASKHASITDANKVLLISPFKSLVSLASTRYGMYPISLILHENLASDAWLSGVTAPITIIHGTADEVIPFEQGKSLFESLPQTSKNFVPVDGAHHNDLFSFDETLSTVGEFLAK